MRKRIVDPMDSLVTFDVQVATWLYGRGTPGFTAFMLVVSLLHGQVAVLIAALGLAAAFHLRGQRRWVYAVILAIPVGMAINALLKEVIQRPRPAFEFPLVTLQTYSFPSGHTAAATLLYGLLAAFLIGCTTRRDLRVAIVLGALAMVALVAFSRMYLGAHYLTDVVAAASLSLLWLTFSLWWVHGRRAPGPR